MHRSHRFSARAWSATGLALMVTIGAMAACSDDAAEPPATSAEATTTTQATTTTGAATTVAAAKTPAATVDELVAGLYAALNAHDDDALRALSTDEARHAVYWANASSQGIQADFAIATYRMATSGIEEIEILGDPIVSGQTVTVPVRYHYAGEGPYIGFDVLVTGAAAGGLLLAGGTTLFADESLTLDPTALVVVEAERIAWNDGDADAVLDTIAENGLFWDDLTNVEATYQGDELRGFVMSSLWFEVETTGEPTPSGPFLAVPNRLVAATDESEGISIYLIRDGKITLHSFAQ
ncbi:MAG: hypothetical protein HZA58_04020 [Acidimicrobiia bacterium]|nr:hypothetical protein [Acidimicrobiia bacterium]